MNKQGRGEEGRKMREREGRREDRKTRPRNEGKRGRVPHQVEVLAAVGYSTFLPSSGGYQLGFRCPCTHVPDRTMVVVSDLRDQCLGLPRSAQKWAHCGELTCHVGRGTDGS